MTRFKTEIKEKPKLTHKEEVRKMFDKRMDDVNRILRYHEDGLESAEISWKIRLAESYIQDVIRDGYDKTKIQLLKQYRLNEGGEKMTERDEHGRFVKKPKQEETIKVEQDEPKVDNPKTEVVTSEKKTITNHIREIAKEIGAFKPSDMVNAFAKNGLSYTKGRISATLKVLDVDNEKHLKLAFLKKDADGKYTIV